MLMSDIVGHSRPKQILQNCREENRVAHAYLFYGAAGVGKTTIARAFAADLLCPDSALGACGSCSVCRRISDDQFPDFIFIAPSGNNIKIEQIRELQRKAQLKPYEAMKKIILIDQAEMMTTEAANCLLKVLEDPPADTVFLLTATNQYSLLPTIISRCQSMPLAKVSTGEIEAMLQENNLATPQNAVVIAALSDGLPGKAWEMAGPGKGLEIRELVFGLVDQITKGSVNDLFKTADELEKKKEIVPEVLEQLLLWYRDQLIWLQTGEQELVMNRDKITQLRDYSRLAGKNRLVSGINDILAAKNQMIRNVNLRLILEVLLLKLAKTA